MLVHCQNQRSWTQGLDVHSFSVTTEISVGLVKSISVINYLQDMEYYSELNYLTSITEPDEYLSSSLFPSIVSLYNIVSNYISFVRPS